MTVVGEMRTPTGGWLLAQLPRAMGRSELVAAFAGAGEEIGDSIRGRIDAVEHQLDPELAGSEMLVFLAGWLGFAIDSFDDPDIYRPFVRRIGRLLRYRGTKTALTELLEVLTGGPVTVEDPGGVFAPGPVPPVGGRRVRVRLSQPGPLGRERLMAVLARELPVGVSVEWAG